MDVQGIITQARDAITVKRAFGDPYEKNGVTVIPVAKVQGGAGGGEGERPQGQESGSGSGFGLTARPVGAYLIRGEEVTWHPAVDVNRIVLGGQIVAVAALLTARAIVNAQTRGRAAAAQRSLLATMLSAQRRFRPRRRWRRRLMAAQALPRSRRQLQARASQMAAQLPRAARFRTS